MKGWLLVGLIACALPGAASAQGWEDYDYENLRFRGLGVEIGRVLPVEIEPAYSFGLRADLGYVGPHVRITPALRFWSSSLREEEVRQLATQIIRLCERQSAATCPSSLSLGEVRRSDLDLSADAHYVFGAPAAFAPYAGGGFSLHLLNGRGESIDGTFVEDLLDTMAPGLNLLGGVQLPLGAALSLMSEARLALTTDVQFATLVAGGSWTLPSPPSNRSRAPRAGERP